MDVRRSAVLALGVLGLAVISLRVPAGAQMPEVPSVRVPLLAKAGPTLHAFVPRGWRIETRLTGEVDADRVSDAVLVLRQADPRNVLEHGGLGISPIDTNPRMLAVLRGLPAGGYALLAQDAMLIPRHEVPTLSDVFDETGGVTLRGRVLKVALYHFANAGSYGMGTTTYALRYQDGCMRLIGYDSNSIHRASGQTEDLSINLLTRRAVLTSGTIEDTREASRTLRARVPGRVCLQDAGAFDPTAAIDLR